MDLGGTIGQFRLSGHYSFLDATYRSTETVDGSANSSNDGPAPGFEGDIEVAKGDRIPLIPRHTAKAGVTWTPSSLLRLTADMVAVAGSYARGNENNGHEPDGVYYLGPGKTNAYAVLNLGGELHPEPHLTLYVQVNNLLDKQYATAAQLSATGFDAAGNFVARPFAGPVIDGERPLVSSTFYAPGTPRSVKVGARVRF
jgi:outer membrane receptor protein involved in Fe transport